ncbi:LpqN/LpqT family lipoprotein [Mycobacterium sp. SMC-18]|uniref:LpqN/LpqT family lipoprotein n=1 Tax=Mycobacterium sp. SMC-18 TaxID=3381629 RepID=UPI00387706D0
MRTSAITGLVAAATALSVVLAGCDSGKDASAASDTATSAAPTAADAGNKAADGPNPTIASYIKEHKITEQQVHRTDPGEPKVDLPKPDGWRATGDDNPSWAYDSIIYNGPVDAANYAPSVVALLSKLTGDVDAKALMATAPGEIQNLPGFTPSGPGTETKVRDYPAYRIAGTWVSDGKKKFVAQQTVIFPSDGATYVLQLNSDGAADQTPIIQAATDVVAKQVKITP